MTTGSTGSPEKPPRAQHGREPERPWEALGPTWVEVDLDVLTANFTEIAAFVRRARPERARELVARHGLRPPTDPVKILVVVKGDAYGHGAVDVARAAVAAGADMLGVSTLAEALELREAGLQAPILMMNPLTPAEAAAAVRAGVTPTLTSLEAAAAVAASATGSAAFPVHISVDTGMSRYGVAPEALPDFAERVAGLEGLYLEGIYTHFSAGSEGTPAGLAVMRRQLEVFAAALALAEARGLVVPLRHAACSLAVLRLPESYLDMVRVGNLFYGYGGAYRGGRRRRDHTAFGDARRSAGGLGGLADDAGEVAPPPAVREAWSLTTRVLEVREVLAGTGVGYGPDTKVRRRTRLATVPVGYADGVGLEIRSTSFRWRVRLRLAAQAAAAWLYRRGLLVGPLARLRPRVEGLSVFAYESRPLDIVGRISMHATILDVTGRPEIGVGSPVTVRVPRVLASPRLPRVYLSSGRAVGARAASGLAEAAAAAAQAGRTAGKTAPTRP